VTLRNELAVQDAARRYQTASIQSDIAYREQRRAEDRQQQAAAEAASRDVVVINGVRVEPGVPVPAGQVTVARPQQPSQSDRKSVTELPRTGAAPSAVPEATMTKFLTVLRENDPQGMREYEAKHNAAEGAAYYSWFLGNFVPDHLRHLIPDTADALFLGESLARWHYHADTPNQTKGKDMPTYEFNGSPAERKKHYDGLTPAIHRARDRHDWPEYRRLVAEREALGPIVHPGDAGPHNEQKQVLV
jgi:hypothetical protein